ncbi:hypothetical protein [Prochlorococcus marinus]|uniref:hypothetical protein n=1 Tax=Prochlorococcus marinus TaxID=1219 RepID=UPI001ADBE6C8|nr:hypothetical protein [Prochlorococcus marinus]MBO8204792.1 hypothetical protein [Prochlorococcus marinus CUG1415]MBW3044074.1 hypothetical protein [Prochlorococcus marinus str. MU1415]
MNKIIIKKLKRFLFIFVFFLFFTQQNCFAGKSEKGGGDSGKSSTTGKKSSNSDSCSSSSGKTSNSTDCDAALSSAATNSSVFSWGGMPSFSPNSEISNYLGGNSFEISFVPGTTTIVTNSIGLELSISSAFTTEGASLITSTPIGLANSSSLVNFNNIDSISLSIGLNPATSNNLSPALSLSVSESKVIVQTNESANQIVESKGIGNSSGVVLTVSPIVAQNIESSIANSGLASLALTINGQFITEPSTAGTNLNNAINALLNSSDLAMAETILPTALNDALDAISQIIPVVEPGDNSRIANVARALHEIKINSIPGLKTN